jgi:hypothetical protein
MDRSYDVAAIEKAVALGDNTGINPEEWSEGTPNIALTDGNGNFTLFVFEYPGVYQGHYFFEVARGGYAEELSKEALRQMFSREDVKAIFGLTPINHKGALWLSKRIGFTPQGIVDTTRGPCQMFTLTKEEYDTWAA